MSSTAESGRDWFRDAGLGLFVHWGLSSVDAREELSWALMRGENRYEEPTEYFSQAERFDPDAYDPDRWVQAAADAGMQYAVLTTKHHDGFALWPSEYGGFGTAEHCDGRDLVGEFVRACRRYDVRVGFYFSLPDWHHPSWPRSALADYDAFRAFIDAAAGDPLPDDAGPYRPYRETVQGQLRELCTRYGDVDLFWLDTPHFHWAGESSDRIGDFYDIIRSHQPAAVVNGRGPHTGWGDYHTPENELPAEPLAEQWELCQTWGDAWGYVEHDTYRSHAWTLERIARTRAMGGNLLLNVGPRADGSLPPQARERLAALGDWIDHSAPSVHGTRAGPWPPRTPADVPVTRGDDVWYLHVLPEAPETIPVENVPEPTEIRQLRNGEPVAWDYRTEDRRLDVTVTDGERASPDEIIAVSWPSSDADIV